MAKDFFKINTEDISTRLHLINEGDTYLIFDINNLKLFKVNKYAYELFLNILDKNCADNLSGFDDVSEIYTILNSIYDTSGNKEISSNTSEEFVLDRLVLNISNDCNLSCRYCYAASGNYREERSYMNEAVAKKSISYFYKIFNRINAIQFFGGEPLLNPEIINVVCEYISEMHNEGIIDSMPAFYVVTNGTIMSASIVKILKKYNIYITLSIDGPEFIHDYLRGNGTFQTILNNFQCFSKNGLKVGVECTYTKYHIDNNINISDLLEFFYKMFGLQIVHIPAVAVNDFDPMKLSMNDLMRSYSQGIKFALKNLDKENYKIDSYTLRLVRAMLSRKKIELYCPAGATTLSVSSKGDVYPCFMFTGNKELIITNVMQDMSKRARLNEISNLFKKINKQNDPRCRVCWARSLCFGCIGADQITSGSLESKPDCQFIKFFIEEFLLRYSEISHNPRALCRMIELSEIDRRKRCQNQGS